MASSSAAGMGSPSLVLRLMRAKSSRDIFFLFCSPGGWVGGFVGWLSRRQQGHLQPHDEQPANVVVAQAGVGQGGSEGSTGPGPHWPPAQTTQWL